MKLMSPLQFEQALIAAGALQNHDAKIKLLKQLRDFDADWIAQFMRNVRERRIIISSNVGDGLAKVAIERSRGAELISLMIEASLEKAMRAEDIQEYVLLTVTFMLINPMISIQLLKACRTDQYLLKMVKLLILAYFKHGGRIEVVTHLTNCNRLETPLANADQTAINWAVPSIHQTMALDIITEARATCDFENQLLAESFDLPCRWDLVDELWHKITDDATYILHTQGDKIEIEIELLKAFKFTHFFIRANGKFPQASVVIHFDKLGIAGIMECDLIDGRLITDGIELCWNEYVRFVATIALLSGYWKIVSEEDDEHLQSGHNGKSSVKTTERKRPKPHPMRLREGFKPSQHAIEECLRQRGQAPAPGKTWRAPKHGSIVVSKATTKVTDDDLSRTLAV